MYAGGGLNYLGLIPGRGQDEVGIAADHAVINDNLVDAGGWDNFESVIEITYKARITHCVSIQPDLQYVIHPSASANIKDAFVAGLRFETAL
jgi:porin